MARSAQTVINEIFKKVKTSLEGGDESFLLEISCQQNAIYYKDNKNQTLLHYAARYGIIPAAENLIRHGARVNARNRKGLTPLYKAVKRSIQMVQFLIDNGANINMQATKTVLQQALEYGSAEMVYLLIGQVSVPFQLFRNHEEPEDDFIRCQRITDFILTNGINYNYLDTRYSLLLHFIVKYGSRETFKNALRAHRSININLQGPLFNTLLHWAIHFERNSLLEDLIKFGADINAVGKDRHTALHYAVRKNNPALVKYLLNLGADVHTRTGELAYTPLHYAVAVGNQEIVEILLEFGADIKAKFGTEILRDSSMLNIVCGATKIKYMVSYYPNEHFQSKKLQWQNPVAYFNTNMIRFLAERGAETEVIEYTFCGIFGLTPLQRASSEGRLDVVQLLLEYGADLYSRNYRGSTMLHHAVIGLNIEMVDLYFRRGLDINEKDICRATPLFRLISLNSDRIIPMLEFIVDNQADPDIVLSLGKNPEVGLSPLYKAARVNQVNVVECLLELGADFDIRDSRQMRPLDVSGFHEETNTASTEVLAAFMALFTDEIYNKTMNNPGLDEIMHKMLDGFLNKCRLEIAQMKQRKICKDRTISFYDLLTQKLLQATISAKSEDIMKVLEAGEFIHDFPTYAFLLQKRVERIRAMLQFVEVTTSLIEVYAEMPLTSVITKHIWSFLQLGDFRNVARALRIL